jgi:mycothiol synthase
MPREHLESTGTETASQLVEVLHALVARAEAAPDDDPDPSVLVIDAEPATEALAEAANTCGFELVRTTLQLRRPLPVEAERRGRTTAIETRAFRVGEDESAWLAVNNRAFAWHPDQSDRTPADLAELEAEPWFRADGFLIHTHEATPDQRPDAGGVGRSGGAAGESTPGVIDGFCWTKIHVDHQPPLGEIYVIGVDPDRHGSGLGRALVLAGLDWLTDQGLTVAMLYVEADNATARHLYDSLGFVEHQAHRWWRHRL